MTPDRIRTLLEQVRDGSLSTEKAMETLRAFPFEDLGFAQLDHHRALRKGFPEVIFCESKTVEQVVVIADRIVSHGADLLATRVTPAQGEALCAAIPQARYNPTARTVALRQSNQPPATRGEILVVCAGTSDLPVAEEALETAKAMGHPVSLLADVGVAGIHRLLSAQDRLFAASVIIVVAGMEGALASVVGGMVGVPVIAVPTSVGYGAHFGGLAALLGMLNSCATGVTVVNIDNGFGAAAAACIINRA
ncbi:MAG TPA: nickel pincer cofactor biosynthesis protein LarB [Candidatus Latescibacteria bacterium]|nr:nickel pincer cofactor biosynthesis protein LarB [Candidatus Latescibacterota bacterium]HOS63838.1 nickel pincer cofactor biosynthesis protein LarB [Candidatus Latescibacterota bacterium]HPK73873.1 nickel pincer cofactor biosynthesis protein LarB [Candidatus Latescibacterota bacterium]